MIPGFCPGIFFDKLLSSLGGKGRIYNRHRISPMPAVLQLISLQYRLNTGFEIEFFGNTTNEFRTQYANVELNYTKVINACNNDKHNWQNSPKIKCRRIKSQGIKKSKPGATKS